MAIIESDKLLHWNYFLSVEEDLHRLARFIELSTDNFETYSIELARILFAASAEVDVVAKQLCGQLRKGCDVSNMNGYREVLWQELPLLADAHVNIPRHGLVLKPWENLRESASPDWWRAYNEVKHERHARYRSANIKNTLNSIGGLFLVLLFFYREQASLGCLKPNPSMLRLGPPLGDDSLFWDPSKAFVYRLDPNGL